MGQRAGQVQLRAVDGEDPVAVPQLASRLARGLLENRPVDTPEHVGVNLGAGRADRRGRYRLRQRQRDPQPTALLPQLGQGQGIARSVGREHQPEDEQHHQQGVEDPLPLLPLPVVLARHAHHRTDDALPQLHEAILGLRLRHQLARLGHRSCVKNVLQNFFGICGWGCFRIVFTEVHPPQSLSRCWIATH